MALTAGQIAQVAREGGFPQSAIPTAVAIALAESSGNPGAHNTNRSTGDNSYGLWQINMLDDLGPQRRRAFGIQSNDELFDPIVNARAARILSKGGKNWYPWSTYRYGKFMKHMPAGQKAAGVTGTATQANWWDDFKKGFEKGFDVGPGPEDLWGTEEQQNTEPGVGDILGGTGLWSIGTMMTGLADALTNPDNWRNWTLVAIGGALVIGGLIVVTRPYANNAISQVAKQLPTGKAAKAVSAAT